MKQYKLPNGKTKTVKPEDEAAFLEQCRKDNITPILISDESQGQTSTEEVDQPQNQQTDIQAPFLESNVLQNVSNISVPEDETKKKKPLLPKDGKSAEKYLARSMKSDKV